MIARFRAWLRRRPETFWGLVARMFAYQIITIFVIEIVILIVTLIFVTL